MATTTKTATAPRRAAKKTRTISVLEFSREPLRIDRDKGVVHGVKILGRVSKNGHRYSDAAIRSGATIYEGADVNLNHPPGREATAERLVQDGFGVIRNPQVRLNGDDETDGVYGDHHFPLRHPYAEQYLENVERFPEKNGFSHNAVVTEAVRDGGVVFESIERVRSVDLVRNPATTRGIFESENMDDDLNPAGSDAGVTDATAPADDDKTTEESIDHAFKLAINAILDDDDLSIDEKKSKIVALLDTHDEVTKETDDDGEKDDDDDDDDDDDKNATESVKQELAVLKRREKARSVLESKGLRPTIAQVKGFAALESDAEKNEYIETLKAAAGASKTAETKAKPRSTAANALESQRQTAGGKGGAGFAVKSQDDLKALTYELMRP